ncbi:MAG: hypothetical protein QM661_15300 [Solimonas sp.]
MDKSQAEAIAKAILEPDLQAQEEIRRKHATGAPYMVHKHQVAWYALAGAFIGGAVAYLIGQRFTVGVVLGALLGTGIGTLAIRRRGKPSAT